MLRQTTSKRCFSSVFSSSNPRDNAAAFLLLREKQQDWNLPEMQLEQAAERIAADEVIYEVANNEHVLFAYSKLLFASQTPQERKRKLLLNSKPLASEMIGIRNRLKLVFGLDSITYEAASYHTFMDQHPEWKKNSNVVVNKRLADRLQPTANSANTFCSLSAPITLAYYLGQEVINLPVYLMQHAPPQLLEDLIWNKRGVNSHKFFNSIAGGTTAQLEDDITEVTAEALESKLRECNTPALVSQMRLPQSFLFDLDTYSYCDDGDGYQPSGGKAKHSMLLVGSRRTTENGNNTRFLLQNWWKDKPFVEVDAAFLKRYGAEVRFAKPATMNNSQVFAMEECAVECVALEAPEV